MSVSTSRIPKPPLAVVVCVKVIGCVLPFAQLVIGAKYQFDCPRERYIPVYLLVMGVITLLLVALNVLPCTAGFGDHSKTWSFFISLFFFCWFIAGNVWIYSIYEPNYSATEFSGNYCNRTLYQFAFWSTNMEHILLGVILLSTFCKWLMCRDD